MHFHSKIKGLARPLNIIQSSYNFAGFISMSKRNLKLDGQSYMRTFIFGGHTTPHLLKISTPTSIWTIRSLARPT